MELRAQPGVLPPRIHQRDSSSQPLLNLDDSFDQDIIPSADNISSAVSSTAAAANAKISASTDQSNARKRKAVQRDKANAEGTEVDSEDYIDVFSIMRDAEAKYDRTATEMYVGLSGAGGNSSFATLSSVTLHAHGRRDKHQKYVIQNMKKSDSVIEKKKQKRKVIEIDGDDDDSEGSDEDSDDDARDEEQIVLEASAFHVIVVAHSDAASPQTDLLDEVKPGFIVLYDADMSVVRSIEVHNSQNPSRIQPLKVYLLMYGT